MRILTVNTGSSSTKLRLLDADDHVVASMDTPSIDELGADGFDSVLSRIGRFDAVGHRVVHGGSRFTGPVLVDAQARRGLEELRPLAPLHQGASLAGIDAVVRLVPEVPNVACFDTSFHATLPPAAYTYAIPAEWNERYGLRRFGFHGLSHAHAARRAAEWLQHERPERLRVVSCHLGSGASLAAVEGGRCMDTTMGFTPLEGLVMATRSGSVDPGLVLWLIQQGGISVQELADALERRSGLAGLAGSADMRSVIAEADASEGRAALAFGVYVHRVKAGIGAMVASLGGLDAVVFTGGVGEHSPVVRQAVADGLGFLGVEVDQGANGAARCDAEISGASATVRTLVIEAREDIEIAAGVRSVVGSPP